MATYLLLLNDDVIEEFEAVEQLDAMHQALDLAAKNRPRGENGSLRWKLAVKGSDGPELPAFMQWGHIMSGDNGPMWS